MAFQNRKILWGSDKNALVALLAINLVVFAMLRMLYVIFQNNQETRDVEYAGLLSQFVLPGTFEAFISKPWTLITHFFTHTSFSVFISNMLWLFSFSWLLQMVAGNKYVIPAYFYGGVFGGLVYLTLNSLFPGQVQANIFTGASAAIFSVSATAVTLAPQFKIFPFLKNGGIPVWVLLAVFTLIDVLSLAFTRPMLIPVHLAGLVVGFEYAWFLVRGRDLGAWMGNLYDYLSGKKIKKQPVAIADRRFYKDETTPYEKKIKVSQTTIDLILDKINEHGYESLSKEERDVLKKAKHEL